MMLCEKSAPLDLGDLVGLGAAGSHDLHRGAFLLADQRARQWRGDGNLALLGVGFDLANDLPHRLFLGVLINQRNGGAELMVSPESFEMSMMSARASLSSSSA